MKKLTSLFVSLAAMSFSGFMVISPALAYADNDSNGKNEARQEIKQAKQEVKQAKQEMKEELKQIKKETKSSFSWGSFMSSIRRNSNPNKFLDWFWGNKKISDNSGRYDDGDDDDDDNGSQNNQIFSIGNINANTKTTSSVVSWTTSRLSSGKILFGTSSTTLTNIVSESGSQTLSHQITLTGLTPDTLYFYVIKAMRNASSTTEITSNVRSFKTSAITNPAADITPPNILFATNIGVNASTTSVIWVTNESSNSRAWISTTTPIATTTAPVASSGTLSFFHQLAIPALATSTLYYYTVSSTDSSGNASYYSNSFTTPAI